MLDTYHEVHTPEGVAIRLPAAGPFARAAAWFIDAAIRYGALAALSGVLGILGEAGAGLYLILLFAATWIYPVIFETLWQGQTPGKRVMKLRVIAANGAPVGVIASITRNLLRTVDALPIGYGVGLVTSLYSKKGRRLGDMVAKTLVIHDIEQRYEMLSNESEIYMPLQIMKPQEQAAVIAFAERSTKLSRERQDELADIAAPLTDARGRESVERLMGTANWLLGKE